MRKIVCRELGDPRGSMNPCQHVFETEMFEVLLDQARTHVEREPIHAKDKEMMHKATEAQTNAWITMARRVFDSTPDE